MSYTLGANLSPISVSGTCGTNHGSYWAFSGCAVGSTVSIFYNDIVGIPLGAYMHSVYYSYSSCSGSTGSGSAAYGTAYYGSNSVSHNPMVICTSGNSNFSTTLYLGYITTDGSLVGGYFVATNQESFYATTITYGNRAANVTFEAPPVSGFFGAC